MGIEGEKKKGGKEKGMRKRQSLESTAADESKTPYNPRADEMFVTSQLTKRLHIPMVDPSSAGDLLPTLTDVFDRLYGGRCCEEGFVRKRSVVARDHSGIRAEGGGTCFVDAMLTCDVFYPVVGQQLHCVVLDANNTTICARSALCPEDITPFRLYLTPDMHVGHDAYDQLRRAGKGAHFIAEVISSRFTLCAPYITITGRAIQILPEGTDVSKYVRE